MRSLLVLGGVLVLLIGAITWKLVQSDPGPTPDADGAQGRLLLGLPEGEGEPLDAATLARLTAPSDRTAPPAGDGTRPAGGSDARGRARPAEAGHETGPAANDRGTADRPVPQPVPPAPLSYVVQSGDSLYAIVLRAYGTAPPDLIAAVAKANGMDDPSRIGADQKLVLPAFEAWPAPALD